MNNAVIIKHEKYGLRIRLDGQEPWEELLADVRDKFTASAGFFSDALLSLTFVGRRLKEEEEDEIIRIITEVTSIRILCVFSEDAERNEVFLRASEAAADYIAGRVHLPGEENLAEPCTAPTTGDAVSEDAAAAADPAGIPDPGTQEEEGRGRCQILTRSLHEGDIVRTHKTVIVLGNVEEGAALTTDRDAIVLGSVRGVVRAGEEHVQERRNFVASSDLRPKKLSIGGVVLRTKSRPFSRPLPAVAAVKDGAVTIVPFDGDVEALLRPDNAQEE